MRRFLAIIVIALIGFGWSQAHAQIPLTGAGRGAPAVAGGCSQATTFLARTSGLSGTETTAYTTMICGMVTDGVWCGTTLDALYIFATNTTTTANLNLCSTSFGLAQTGSVTFSADHGYTGDGSTGFLDTGFTPSTAGGNWVLNSATIGAYILTNRTTNATNVALGSTDASGSTGFSYIQPLNTTFQYDLNGNTFPTVANGSARGHWLVTRTSSSLVTAYKNGASFGSSGSDTSTTLPNQTVLISALHDIGSIDDFSNDQVAAAYFGSGINATQAAAIDTRINGYMTALGINVH